MSRKPISFEEGVQFAKETIRHFQQVRSSHGRLIDRTDPVAFDNELAGSLGASYLSDDKHFAQLFEDSETDYVAFNTLRHGLATLLDYNALEMSPAVRTWLSRYLRGEVSAPPKKAGRKQNSGPHHVIEFCVSVLVHKGMNATRNDESPPKSACDAVALALSQLGMRPTTFEAVKRVYFEQRRFVHWAP